MRLALSMLSGYVLRFSEENGTNLAKRFQQPCRDSACSVGHFTARFTNSDVPEHLNWLPRLILITIAAVDVRRRCFPLVTAAAMTLLR